MFNGYDLNELKPYFSSAQICCGLREMISRHIDGHPYVVGKSQLRLLESQAEAPGHVCRTIRSREARLGGSKVLVDQLRLGSSVGCDYH